MLRFFTSGGVFILLGLAIIVFAVIAEKPDVYIGAGAMWLIVGIVVAVRQRQ